MITRTRDENASLLHALFEEIEEWIAARAVPLFAGRVRIYVSRRFRHDEIDQDCTNHIRREGDQADVTRDGRFADSDRMERL
jgi:hypothetical protein